MSFWRFIQIIKVAHKINQIESGIGYVEKGIPESSKSMIAARKKQR